MIKAKMIPLTERMRCDNESILNNELEELQKANDIKYITQTEYLGEYNVKTVTVFYKKKRELQTRYVLLKDESAGDLNVRINDHLEAGYTLHGETFSDRGISSDGSRTVTRFYQSNGAGGPMKRFIQWLKKLNSWHRKSVSITLSRPVTDNECFCIGYDPPSPNGDYGVRLYGKFLVDGSFYVEEIEMTQNNPQFKNGLSTPFIVPQNLSDNDLREWLIARMNELDVAKRHITEQLSRYHEDTWIPRERGRDFYAWVRRAKAKQSHLKEERERLRGKLGEVNARIKEDRRKKNGKVPKINLAQCFMVAAEDLLDPETYREIENKALTILEA